VPAKLLVRSVARESGGGVSSARMIVGAA